MGRIEVMDGNEVIGHIFSEQTGKKNDPRSETIYYPSYKGHELPPSLSFAGAENSILKKHIEMHHRGIATSPTRAMFRGETP